jgi:hypothetical protein
MLRTQHEPGRTRAQVHALFDFTLLDDTTWQHYAGLARPTMPDAIRRAGLNRGMVAIGATFWGRPAGLIVVELHGSASMAVVRELQVAGPYRTTPIGACLLEQADVILRERSHLRGIELHYRLDQDRELYEQAIAGAGWQTPRHLHDLYQLEWELDQVGWVRNYRLPPGYTIVSWSEVTPAMLAQIERRQQHGWYPPEVSPFILATIEQIDLPCSIALVRGDDVAGWILGERLAPAVAYVAVAFISPELRRGTRAGVAMMTEIARRHWAAGVRTSILETRPGSTMARFFEKTSARFIAYRTQTWGSYTHFTTPSDPSHSVASG